MSNTCVAMPEERAGLENGQVKGIVNLEFAERSLPSWHTPGARLRVPVPGIRPAQISKQEVLVWGVFGPGGRVPLISENNGCLDFAYDWDAWKQHILTEAYATWRRRPLYTRSPISYRVVPGRIRNALAGRMCAAREHDEKSFPNGLVESGFEALIELLRSHGHEDCVQRIPPRLCLTHDIDTADGWSVVKEIANVEAAMGLRSCWNVVPHGYKVDYHVCDWLVERGFEIGLHGHCHDNRLIYLAEPAMRRRLDACGEFIERYAVKGFRSPSWFRNMRLMRVLADYVEYDCSCLDFDWLCPAGRGGVLTASPFRFGNLVEIPTTLPFEAPMLVGADPSETVSFWRPKTKWLLATGGHGIVNTHPDPQFLAGGLMIRAYERFLEELLESFEGRWSLPIALARETSPDA